ncbi:hypothetical protein [Nocardia sp. NPDC004711]
MHWDGAVSVVAVGGLALQMMQATMTGWQLRRQLRRERDAAQSPRPPGDMEQSSTSRHAGSEPDGMAEGDKNDAL